MPAEKVTLHSGEESLQLLTESPEGDARNKTLQTCWALTGTFVGCKSDPQPINMQVAAYQATQKQMEPHLT